MIIIRTLVITIIIGLGSIILTTSVMAEPLEISPSKLALILPDSLDPDEGNGSRLLMKFELPEKLDFSRVGLAWIQFDISVPVERGNTTLLVHVFPITTDWIPEAVNWNNPWNDPGGDINNSLDHLYFLKAGAKRANRIDVTDIYRLYAKGELPNLGLLFTIEHVDRVAYRLLKRLQPEFVKSLRLMIE